MCSKPPRMDSPFCLLLWWFSIDTSLFSLVLDPGPHHSKPPDSQPLCHQLSFTIVTTLYPSLAFVQLPNDPIPSLLNQFYIPPFILISLRSPVFHLIANSISIFQALYYWNSPQYSLLVFIYLFLKVFFLGSQEIICFEPSTFQSI